MQALLYNKSTINKMCTLEQELINIGGLCAIDDSHYRYRMPKLESRQNKKKTLLSNILEIAKSLHPSDDPRPDEIVKFLALELGTTGTCPPVETLKRLANDPGSGAYLAGKHPQSTLQGLIAVYVEHFVLCQLCRHPVSRYKVSKHGNIVLPCGGCGERTEVPMDHKLCRYIVKKHEAKKAAQKIEKKKAEAKREKKRDKLLERRNYLTGGSEDHLSIWGT